MYTHKVSTYNYIKFTNKNTHTRTLKHILIHLQHINILNSIALLFGQSSGAKEKDIE